MKKRTASKVIQVPIDDESEAASELDRRYVTGSTRKREDPASGRLGAKLLARRLERDRWEMKRGEVRWAGRRHSSAAVAPPPRSLGVWGAPGAPQFDQYSVFV